MLEIDENVHIKVYNNEEVLLERDYPNSFTDTGLNYLRDMLEDSGGSAAHIANMLITHASGTFSQSTTNSSGATGVSTYEITISTGTEYIISQLSLRNSSNDVYTTLNVNITKPSTYYVDISWRITIR